LSYLCFYPEDGGDMFLRNVGLFSHCHKWSYPGGQISLRKLFAVSRRQLLWHLSSASSLPQFQARDCRWRWHEPQKRTTYYLNTYNTYGLRQYKLALQLTRVNFSLYL
jgi:hypothetical protein